MLSLKKLAAVALAVSAPAQATTSVQAGLQAMRELNLIVLDDLETGHDVEGKVFVGGKITGNSATFGIGNASQGAKASTRRTLTVGGNVGPQININNGSNGGQGPVATTPGILVGGNVGGLNINAQGAAVDVGGNFGGNLNLSNGQVVNIGGSVTGSINGSNNSQTVRAGGSINGNANGAAFISNLGAGWNAASTSVALAAERSLLQTNLTDLSIHLRDLTLASNPSSLTLGNQGPIFNAVNGGNGFALFNVAGSLFNTGQIDFTTVGGPMPIIVNVSGTHINWTGNAVGGYNASLNPFIIWNFHEATSVDFTRMVHGSVLAPLARITNITPIEGSVVARSFKQGGEVHLGTFGFDDLPGGGTGVVPEPASWAMLIAGFGLVGAAARRRRAAAA